MAHRWQYIRWLLAWLLTAVIGLSLLGLLSIESFVVAAATGVLVVTELTRPARLSPAWHRQLRWLVALALASVAVLIASEVLSLLPPGGLP
ncbi:hypothetical protein N0B31_20040 [Salinirubellus salinus]|uniref:Uncharacterized protein n=1 Tax=Salinirubellus salinus TaxID=1364945 RepID=A0A9E7R273_9EURY|nr:hypothetical protein [Salinirubellus salinus]UWM54396.1 hypothetical protein N0B31_20040 [Salinirubellus salinus]